MRSHPVERPEFLDYRATILLCVASLILSVREFQGSDMSVLHIDHQVWPEEPWRLFTACLLHGGWIHLIFNIYWTFRFGSILEPVLGMVPMIGVVLLLGLTSSGAQWAFDGGGVGLSGVGYGLFGILWALDRYHPNFRGVLSEDLVKLFVIWFFICIIATRMGAMQIANIAHGVGAVVGGLFGLTLTPLGMKRRVAWLILGGLTLGISLASTIGRPYVNFSEHRVWELNFDAYAALEANELNRAAELYLQAISMDEENAHSWHNLGVTYGRLGKWSKAMEAIERAEELERLNPPEEESPEGRGFFGEFPLGK